ncbi:(Fe-S)-binding protein [Desulfocurvus sp. DL9XJH121]
MPIVDLFVPCLVEEFLPDTAQACVNVLTRLGAEVCVPGGQTCCGQPLYKAGRMDQARETARRHLALFEGAEHVVAPSGSCVYMMRTHYPELFADDPGMRERALALGRKTFEFCEYVVNVLGVTDVGANLTARAAYHDSCQVGRSLGLVKEPRALLDAVRGLTRLELEHPGECCGFGGPFSVQHAAVSGAILEDKLKEILATDPDFVVTAEPSCLLNIRGGLSKLGTGVPVTHVADVLDMGLAS